MPFLFMRDRKDVMGEFSIAAAAASGKMNCYRRHERVDIKERTEIEN